MEDYQDREITLDARAIPHLPGAFVFDERSGIEKQIHALAGRELSRRMLALASKSRITRGGSWLMTADVTRTG